MHDGLECAHAAEISRFCRPSFTPEGHEHTLDAVSTKAGPSAGQPNPAGYAGAGATGGDGGNGGNAGIGTTVGSPGSGGSRGTLVGEDGLAGEEAPAGLTL